MEQTSHDIVCVMKTPFIEASSYYNKAPSFLVNIMYVHIMYIHIMYVCMYVYVCVCVCGCMCVCICVYICVCMWVCQLKVHNMYYQGSDPTWKTLKISNFVILFSRPGKCLEFAQKVVKTWNFNSKPGKNLKFENSMFQTSLFKNVIHKNKSDLLLCDIYIINTNTDSNPI